MKKISVKLLLMTMIGLLISVNSLLAQSKSDSIFIGSPAPSLVVNKWIKGAPFKLDRGKTYVIGFTMIGCPHCGPAIPVLTNIVKKYADDVTVLNIYFDDAKEVEQYIKKLGDKVGFAVAADNSVEDIRDRIMYKSWMVNSGSRGFPTAFIVNRDGNIAYIGHPCSWYFEKVVNQIVSTGTYDEENVKHWREAGSVWWKAVEEAFVDSSKYSMAINLTDSLLKMAPENRDYKLKKLELLIRYDEQKAYQYAKETLNDFGQKKEWDPWNTLIAFSDTFIENADKLENPDWDFVASLAARQNDLSDDMISANCYHSQAEAMFLKGDYRRAVELQEQAIKKLRYLVRSSPTVNQYYKSKLTQYKEKAG